MEVISLYINLGGLGSLVAHVEELLNTLFQSECSEAYEAKHGPCAIRPACLGILIIRTRSI